MKKIFIVVILIAFNEINYGQTNNSISEKLTEELHQIYAHGHINGFSVAIVDKDSQLYAHGFGYSDVKNKRQYTEHTIQNIASISKTFIGVALMKAQELGKLNLDDPINKYLPFNVVNPHFPTVPITIRQLATHTSSIKDPSRYEHNGYILKEGNSPGAKQKNNFRPPDEMIPLGQFLESILSEEGKWYKKKTFLKNKPGEHFEYSNIGAGLAAIIIEQAVGSSFHEFTKTHIFHPLGMTETGWSFDDIDFSNHSKLYQDTKTELTYYRLVNYPDGGLITSASDLSKFLSELMKGYAGEGRILKKESFEVLFQPQLTETHLKKRSENPYNDEYNSGILMGISAKGYIGHTGGDPGVVTFMFFNPNTMLGKILIVNTELKKKGISEFIAIWKKLNEYETQIK